MESKPDLNGTNGEGEDFDFIATLGEDGPEIDELSAPTKKDKKEKNPDIEVESPVD